MISAKYAWMDGQILPFADAKIHVLSHSLHYANAVFEGLRAYKSSTGMNIFKLKAHTKRLLESAKIIKIKPNYSQDELNDAQIELLRANDFKKNVYIRPLIYLGEGVMGLHHINAPIHTAITAWEWGAYLGEKALDEGIRVKISSFRKSSESFNHAKVSANYLISQMAKYEAIEAGYDEALLLDSFGLVAEASAECFFMIKDGVLYTPPGSFTLKSITQETIIELAKYLKIPFEQRQIAKDELYIADEAFLVGSAAELTPISCIDDRKIPQNTITKSLQKAYFDLVYARDLNFKHYLTKI